MTSPMKVATPHYLLFSESSRKNEQAQWRFVLQSVDGAEQFEAADDEPDVQGDRLELLAVVRGLEALEQPSRVTLVTPSKYVNRGLTFGLQEWRANDWEWEHYGEMVPVKNRDLWQRVDRALRFHQLECRTWRFDLPHSPQEDSRGQVARVRSKSRRDRRSGGFAERLLAALRSWWNTQRGASGFWPALRNARCLPLAWFQ